MKDNLKNHTFVILAYKESKYLEECILSVVGQSLKSRALIATSTPNRYINSIASKYGIDIIENPNGSLGMVSDFNFALEVPETKFVTIVHQDDIYDKNYLEEMSDALNDNVIIAFTDYSEIHDGKVIDSNKNLKIKRFLMNILKINNNRKFFKRRFISLGNPICCPSVTFNKERVNNGIFNSPFFSNMDWAAWEKLSKEEGCFTYINKKLLMHRIHEDSTTTEIINSNRRTEEDYMMFVKFWPRIIARFLTNAYKESEKSNG